MRHPACLAPPALALLLAACSCSGGEADATSTSSASGGGGAGSTSPASGPGPVTATGTSTTSTGPTASGSGAGSSTSSGGGGDPRWRPVPWWAGDCAMEYAENPAEAFPVLEWTSCSNGPAGCQVLVRNWEPFSNAALAFPVARRVGDEYEFSFFTSRASEDSVALIVRDGAPPSVVYRTPPGSECTLAALFFAQGGHWAGNQWYTKTEGLSTYVHQPDGSSPEVALVTPLNDDSQRQVGAGDLFAVQRLYAAGISIFDRASGQAFTSPPALSSRAPRITSSAVFYIRSDAVDDPTGWVWDRQTGAFRELIGAGANVVGELRGDEQTLLWTELPPALPDGSGFPPGTLFTSPFTIDAKAIVPTARWSNLPVGTFSPSAMGGGYYAVAGDGGHTIYLLRLADGRRWVVPIPNDEFSSEVQDIPLVDDRTLFLRTATQIYRIPVDQLGPGLPAE